MSEAECFWGVDTKPHFCLTHQLPMVMHSVGIGQGQEYGSNEALGCPRCDTREDLICCGTHTDKFKGKAALICWL